MGLYLQALKLSHLQLTRRKRTNMKLLFAFVALLLIGIFSADVEKKETTGLPRILKAKLDGEPNEVAGQDDVENMEAGQENEKEKTKANSDPMGDFKLESLFEDLDGDWMEKFMDS